jgi:hypothetical protein
MKHTKRSLSPNVLFGCVSSEEGILNKLVGFTERKAEKEEKY